MSDDMSMFKKMRDKITDEVNSATNKLQSMQIIDQLATSIGQQTTSTTTTTAAMPPQTLPILPQHQGDGTPTAGHLNLAYDNSSNSQEEEELNSETSPQHQLFNEQTIRRLKSPSGSKIPTRSTATTSSGTSANGHNHNNPLHPVIDIEHLGSDIEDDIEVDLLHEKEVHPSTSGDISHSQQLDTYKARYRELVHALRKLNRDHSSEKSELQSQTSELRDHIIALDRELNVLKQQREQQQQQLQLSSNDTDRKTNSSSPHQSSATSSGSNSKQSSKIRDLEKLMAKCKESLKTKNTQLKILKESLGEVDKFRDHLGEIKNELKELRNAHETWTLSIAENKRVAHREIEDKNSEINDLQGQLRNCNSKVSQLKASMQNLESRLVSTSAAHQKERESLIKQLTAQKNSAIKQVQKEHELHVERIKLDLEKSIEALKTEILTKDELIIRSAEKQNELQRQNCALTTDLESAKRFDADRERDLEKLRSQDEARANELQELRDKLDKSEELGAEREREIRTLKSRDGTSAKEAQELQTQFEAAQKLGAERAQELDTFRAQAEERLREIDELKGQLESVQQSQHSNHEETVKKNEDLERCNQELSGQVCELTDKVNQLEATTQEQQQRLKEAQEEAAAATAAAAAAASAQKPDKIEPCVQCQEYMDQLRKGAEQHEQSLFELNAKLDLLTTANNDQEKAIRDLNEERTATLDTVKNLRSECDELAKKNTSILQVMQDNESEMQSQQDQLDQLKSVRLQLDELKKENASLSLVLGQIRSELAERNNDLKQSNESVTALRVRLAELELAHKSSSAELDSVKREKEALVATLDTDYKKRRQADQQLVVNILAALKNLETPETSPGSDKTFSPEKQTPGRDDAASQVDEVECNLPDPLKLAENLSSLALDRSTAYMTSTQQLQAVLLDNTMISEEVSRLKEELNALSYEKTQEVMSSIEEVERLRTENQALIHDQKAYDDHIAQLEAEIESTKQKLVEVTSRPGPEVAEASTATSEVEDLVTRQLGAEQESKREEIERLRKLIADKQKEQEEEQLKIRSLQMVKPAEEDVPSSTEFEYLKNIVYQFLMGREPITLARVISAIFKFEQEQIDQICKVQEVIHQVSG